MRSCALFGVSVCNRVPQRDAPAMLRRMSACQRGSWKPWHPLMVPTCSQLLPQMRQRRTLLRDHRHRRVPWLLPGSSRLQTSGEEPLLRLIQHSYDSSPSRSTTVRSCSTGLEWDLSLPPPDVRRPSESEASRNSSKSHNERSLAATIASSYHGQSRSHPATGDKIHSVIGDGASIGQPLRVLEYALASAHSGDPPMATHLVVPTIRRCPSLIAPPSSACIPSLPALHGAISPRTSRRTSPLPRPDILATTSNPPTQWREVSP